METWLDKLFDNIVIAFNLGDRKNVNIMSRIGDGFSGAEVYLIELQGDSAIKGNYFLKIDSEADEYENNQNTFCFSKVVKCVEKRKIEEYYVMLLHVAGRSSLEYQSFYSINKSSIKIEAVRKMIGEILEQATSEGDIIRGDMLPSEIFKMQLKNKLNSESVLFEFLSSHLQRKSLKDIYSIQVGKVTLPNAFAFAINDEPWNGKKIKNMVCSIHGDLHGNNVFVSNKKYDYAMIDMASFRNDGWLFFDSAYFEFSLMLRNMEKESLDSWLYCVDQTAQQAWDEVDFKDSRVIQSISEEEEKWIKKKNNDNYSYLDQLRLARLMARVLVGLNYAGKKKMQDEARLKAFLFACCYLKYLLKAKEINFISSKMCVWKFDSDIKVDNDEYDSFLEFVDRFDDSQDYYFILGRRWDYSDSVSMNLGKIRLSGVMSFCLNKGFADIMEKKQLLRYVFMNNRNTWSYIEKDNTWWLFADGMLADPESQTEKFSTWRNKYREFWNLFADKMIESAGEDDLLFIIDWREFREGDDKYIRHLLNQLDAIESTVVNVAILDPEVSFEIDTQEYENLNIRKFKVSIENVADYCSQYMADVLDDVIYIPNRQNRMGIPLDKEDQQYIEQYTLLVHEQLIRRENILEESKKYNFFYGEPITWTAIEEELYVKHKKIIKFENDIRQKLENTNKDQFIVPIQHSPGAGATILGKVICWNLKKEYPTVVLQNKIDEDVYESLLRIATISGKHLLILLDGNYNQNDVHQFIFNLSGMRIKACVLYPCRIYSTKIGDDGVVSALDSRDGNRFRDEYEKVMKKWKDYDEEECKRRVKNMNNLTTENNLVDFRLPFFYGMHAFENEYKGIHEYLDDVVKFMEQNKNMEKVICYIALISYYTENRGLGFNYAKKLLKMKESSGRELLKELQRNFPKIIYIVNSSYRICHPVIAREILKKKFVEFQSDTYKEFCIQFIEDLRKCESRECLSNRYQELMMDVFIMRDTEGEMDENDIKKKSFSQIILDVNNPNLQEQIFERLVKAMPQNPHFRQHYGRLIIANNPVRLKEAEEQLDEAIKLDSKNGSFYHSRGNLYVQYVLYQMNNEYKKIPASELFNKLRHFVDLAISDFECSMDLEEKGNNVADLVYPYASIIQISTSFVHQLAVRSDFVNNEKAFLEKNNEMGRWSKSLISKAILCDMDTELRYSSIRDNKFYDKTRNYLLRFKWTFEELEANIKQYPNDYDYQVAYLGMSVSDKNAWKQKSQQQLKQVVTYCENLLKLEQYRTEGILWKWFNANIHLKRPINESYSKMLGVLETLPEWDVNPTANYLRSILYFCKYMQTKDEKIVDAMYECLNVSKRLAGDKKNRSITHYYYTDEKMTGQNILPLEFERENAYWFDGTVISADSNQSGYLTLDMNPKLRAFFVPIHTDLKRNQEVGQLVKVKVGFRFDGLSAWELQQKI